MIKECGRLLSRAAHQAQLCCLVVRSFTISWSLLKLMTIALMTKAPPASSFGHQQEGSPLELWVKILHGNLSRTLGSSILTKISYRQKREGEGKKGPRGNSLRDGRLEQVWILRKKLSTWCDLIELLLTISLATIPLLGTYTTILSNLPILL